MSDHQYLLWSTATFVLSVAALVWHQVNRINPQDRLEEAVRLARKPLAALSFEEEEKLYLLGRQKLPGRWVTIELLPRDQRIHPCSDTNFEHAPLKVTEDDGRVWYWTGVAIGG